MVTGILTEGGVSNLTSPGAQGSAPLSIYRPGLSAAEFEPLEKAQRKATNRANLRENRFVRMRVIRSCPMDKPKANAYKSVQKYDLVSVA